MVAPGASACTVPGMTTPPTVGQVQTASLRNLASLACTAVAARLAEWGLYDGPVDETVPMKYPESAVIAFQREMGFRPTGSYSPQTHKALWD